MTTIRTTCPRCGEVDMGPEAILLSVRENGREGSYRFRCPNCADRVEKRADRKIVALLVSAGVDIERSDGGTLQSEASLFDHEELDGGPMNPELAPAGPPLTVDDMIEFHYLLEDDRYIHDFLAKQ